MPATNPELPAASFRGLRTGLAIALGAHLLWAALAPAPSLVAASGAGLGSVRVAYDPLRTWKALRDERPEDPRWLRSTALLVLPSPEGFSEVPVEELVVRDPSWLIPAQPPTDSPAQRPEGWGPLLTLEREPARPFSRDGLDIREPAVFSGMRPALANTLHITWDEGFGNSKELVVAADDAVWGDTVPWEATSHVVYDEYGRSKSVLLDPDAGLGASRRVALMRLLQATAAPTGFAGRTGFVKIWYTGSTGVRP